MRGVVRRIDLPTSADIRGSLTVAEVSSEIPFIIRRAFVLHGLSVGRARGDHANLDEQLLVAVAGSIRVRTHDGVTEMSHVLDTPEAALVLGSMVWRTIDPLVDDSICLVLSSMHYSADLYIRDFELFLSRVEVGQ